MDQPVAQSTRDEFRRVPNDGLRDGALIRSARAQGHVVRLAHAMSSDFGVPGLMPYVLPLLERGWSVTLISPPGRHTGAAIARGVRWRPLGLTRSIDPLRDLAGTAQLVSYLLKDRYDILHTHNVKVGLIARVVGSLARVPVVVHSAHGLIWSLETPKPKRSVHVLLERLASLGVDAVLVQSLEDRRCIVETHILPPEKVVLIGNGVDLRRFDPDRVGVLVREATRRALGVRADEILVMAAGRLLREKGCDELIDAIARARMHDRRVRLALAGPLDVERGEASLIPTAKLERARADGVLVLGQRDDMPELYAASDIVVLASWREGLPRVLLEAAAMGKPLVATDVRGCREVVRTRDSGLLVPPRNAAALAEAILSLAANAAERERIAAHNRAEARARFDLEAVVARVFQVYERGLMRAGIDS